MNLKSKMTRIVVLATVLAAAAASAQAVPQQLSFTANLSNSGSPVSGSHPFVFTLYDALTAGNVAWTETQPNLAVTNGLVFTRLGLTTPLTPTILNGAPLWLEVSVDGTPLSPRAPIVSVPYAIRAAVATSAETLGTLLPSEVQKRVNGSCSGSNALQSIDADGGVGCVSIAGGTGDITSVNTSATSGLAGGVTAGDANLSLASCPLNQVLKSTGSGWSCQPDSNSGGTVTSINAGTGLTGGAITTSGTIGLAATVQNWASQPGCPGGQYMRTIAADGTATCVPDGNSGGTVTSVGAGAGLTGGPITGAGVLAVNFGAAAGTVTQGNDPRLLPPPSGAGRMLYDNGGAWVQLGAGTGNNVLVGGATPSWSSATGITSVGTLSSVNVSGTATVGSLAFSAAKTSYVTVQASAFHPIRSTEGYGPALHCCGNDRSYVAAAGFTNGLIAPVSFPHGATPTALTCRVLDTSATFDVTVRLVEAVNSSAYCSSTSAGTSATWQNLTSGCGGLGAVDNTTSAWYLQFYNDGACGTSCAIKSCTATYTMISLP